MSQNMNMSGHHQDIQITVGWTTTAKTITTVMSITTTAMEMKMEMEMAISHQCLATKIQMHVESCRRLGEVIVKRKFLPFVSKGKILTKE